MRVQASKDLGYQPLTLTLTFEGQNEFDAIYNLFNHIATSEYLEAMGIDTDEVRAELRYASGSRGAVAGVTSLSAAIKRWAKGEDHDNSIS